MRPMSVDDTSRTRHGRWRAALAAGLVLVAAVACGADDDDASQRHRRGGRHRGHRRRARATPPATARLRPTRRLDAASTAAEGTATADDRRPARRPSRPASTPRAARCATPRWPSRRRSTRTRARRAVTTCRCTRSSTACWAPTPRRSSRCRSWPRVGVHRPDDPGHDAPGGRHVHRRHAVQRRGGRLQRRPGDEHGGLVDQDRPLVGRLGRGGRRVRGRHPPQPARQLAARRVRRPGRDDGLADGGREPGLRRSTPSAPARTRSRAGPRATSGRTGATRTTGRTACRTSTTSSSPC